MHNCRARVAANSNKVPPHLWWYLFCIILLGAGQPSTQSSRASRLVTGTMRGSQRQEKKEYSPIPTLERKVLLVQGELQQQRRRVANATDIFNTTTTGGAVTDTLTNLTGAVKGTYNEVTGTPPNQWSQRVWIIVVIVLAVSLCLIGCLWKMLPCCPRIC